MVERARNRNLPSYGMVGSAAARQSEGPGAASVEFLRKGGCLDEDAREKDLNPLESPLASMESPEAPPEPPAHDEPRPAEAAPPTNPEATDDAAAPPPSRQPTRRRKSTPHAGRETRSETSADESQPTTERKRRVRRTPSRFDLPPPKYGETLSRHFRLPLEVDQHLGQLAGAHGCTRTHVVCALIESAWKGLTRRKAKPTDAGSKPSGPQSSD